MVIVGHYDIAYETGIECQRRVETMRMQFVVITLIAISLSGCATTPGVTLKNDATGEVVRCGGKTESTGLVEYNIQKEYDDQCIRYYESQGFNRVP
jgi:hypothetical protein